MTVQAGFFDLPRCTTCSRERRDLLGGLCPICRAGVQGRPSSTEAPTLNDHFIAHYARLWLAHHPEHPRAFETRHLRASNEQEREWRSFHLAHPEVWRAFNYVALQALAAVRDGRITARMVWEVIRLRLRASKALDLGEGLERAMRDRSADVGVTAWTPPDRASESGPTPAARPAPQPTRP